MAFGVDPHNQRLGDVLVSKSLIPYDNRIVKGTDNGYVTDYSPARREPARRELTDLFLAEQKRNAHLFTVHFGAMLSGAARIQSLAFRNELVAGVLNDVSLDGELIVGGDMEGVGLPAASTTPRGCENIPPLGLESFGRSR